MANVTIDVAAEFKGKPAFDKAGNAVNGLDKAVGKLGKQLAGVFAAKKILDFGKASIKAFEEDQKSAALLANTMKNLGMQFATPVLEGYIANLSKTAAVADDVLRPAMQKLLTQTGDYAKSQELLNQSIEISRGSGVELNTVVADLSAAYVGNTKGLKKYNLGLTQAELKTMKFADIQKKLTAQFKGSNAAYLKTYAGQMETLKVAAGEAQETIGKGLLDSLALLAGDGSVSGLATAMQNFADFTSNAIYGVAALATELKNLGAATPDWLKKLFGSKAVTDLIKSTIFGPLYKPVSAISAYGEKQQNKKLQNPSVQMFMTDEANNRLNNQKAKATKEQVKATKALTAEQKKQALLKKQGTIFDLEQIGLVAALKGKLSEDERNRVLLQLALLQGNEEEAKRLTALIADATNKTGELKKYLNGVEATNNPFKSWQDYLNAIEAQAARIAAMGSPVGAVSTNAGNTSTGTLVPNFTPPAAGTYGTPTGAVQGPVAVTVQIDGKTIASTLMDQSLSGNQSYVDRRTGGFNW